MHNNTRWKNNSRPLFLGIETSTGLYISTALIQRDFPNNPQLQMLHDFKPQHFERWIDRHFSSIIQADRLTVAFVHVNPPGLGLWLQERVRTCLIDEGKLAPFLQEAEQVKMPDAFKRAYSIALCASSDVTTQELLSDIRRGLSDIHSQIQTFTNELRKFEQFIPTRTR